MRGTHPGVEILDGGGGEGLEPVHAVVHGSQSLDGVLLGHGEVEPHRAHLVAHLPVAQTSQAHWHAQHTTTRKNEKEQRMKFGGKREEELKERRTKNEEREVRHFKKYLEWR
jgi:hypothetical protein